MRPAAVLLAASAVCLAAACGGESTNATLEGAKSCLKRQKGAIVSNLPLGQFRGEQGAAGALLFVFPLHGGEEPPAQGLVFIARTPGDTARLDASLGHYVNQLAQHLTRRPAGIPTGRLRRNGNALYLWVGKPTQADDDILAACLQ